MMIKQVKNKLISLIPYDEKVKFRDLSRIKKENRVANSKVLNFYSSNNNIGNYTPVLGIQQLLQEEFDTWCAHKDVDWDFVNSNYEKIIIGGAGLFHKSFQKFWIDFYKHCRIPSIVWGVGGIFPKDSSLKSSVDSEVLKEALKKCDFINLRDTLSANYVDLGNIHISPCPTIAMLQERRANKNPTDKVLYSSHEELLNKEEKDQVRNFLEKNIQYSFTSNIQSRFNGLNRILENFSKSKFIVTTRLHGAIIAYGLGIPYLAISFDNKVDEFQQLYGNGEIIKSTKDLNGFLLSDLVANSTPQEPDLSQVNFFANRIKKEWL